MTPAHPPTAPPPGRVPGSPYRTTAGAACAAALALLLTACGLGGDDKGSPDHSSDAASEAVITPTASAPVPHGKGSRLPDDLNGDGYPDLQLPVPSRKEGLPTRAGFVYSSAKGLNPATRTVLRRRDLGLPAADVTVAGGSEVTTADLDDDGYADVTTTAGERLSKREAERTHTTVRTVPYISWGSAGGPRKTRAAARVQLTGPDDSVDTQRPTVGDFDGDGRHDLALIRADRRSLLVMYGPFTRAGKAARTVPYASPLHEHGERTEIGDLIADKIDGDRPTDLVVHALNDEEQSGSTLMAAGPDGLRATGRKLRKGNSVAFGDFDGDGKRDVAVGDSGSRNDEPGYETERPDIGETVSVYPHASSRAGGRTPHPIKVPKMSGVLAAADTNGDHTDELAVSLGSGGVELLTLRHGSSDTVADRRTLTRAVPARLDGEKVRKGERAARLYRVTDFDHDGKDEVVLAWGRGLTFSRYGEHPERWWVTDGRKDRTAFTSDPYADDD
ncbi:FG-GAP repeat protein [Streptomyces sp. NA02950]|uniref:FG-GAP repeat protein n=1 Tax=Streptomyces sp. NA02950 TaxID=2742137 RepID=UPI001590946A|nr:FG-GAP repeat protein [Streptomyces sp. NA02950]QKV93604.1 FG-GAP repeat protein [Streptomyces sp. NA02950]